MKFLLVLTLFCYTLGINQQCQTTQQCPQNSYCQLNDMCACNTNFIGSCSTSAFSLSQSSINVVLDAGTTTFFYVNPQQLNIFIQITFQICLNQLNSINTVLTLWGQTGNNTVYTLSNALGNPTSANLSSGCQQFITPYITFDYQPNGQNQMLVLGITDNSATASISISASQQQISGAFIYYYIIVAIVVVVVIVIIVGTVVALIRRRRRNMAYIVQEIPAPATITIDHFANLMPSFFAQKLGPQKQICSICLGQIELTEMVRQTPCKHTFHSSCIDSWCKKNLSCPVCRTDLTYQKIMELLTKNNYSEPSSDRGQLDEIPAIPPEPIAMANNQQSIKTEQSEQARYINFDQQKYQIRENML